MVFSSLLFLFRFLPILLLAYFAAPARLRNGVLFIGSLVFYGWGEPVYITLLLFSTAIDFIHGFLVERFLELGDKKRAGWAVASSVVVNLSLLCFFKYADFLIEAIGSIGGAFRPLNLPLPIGISFYTFQTMSYTIDIYRGKAKAQRNIVAFGAYVSMFPQLIAGPIVRYGEIAEELTKRKETLLEFSCGIQRFVAGLGKKVLIANQIGSLWNEIIQIVPQERSVLMVWLGIVAFGMQIYFDFSGYSDMAIGLGRMFGFHFPENFHYPYESRSITEFWRRWHISLGSWFKEYVYIPLGGARKGKVRQIRNILAVWLLTGIWHGAGWNFLSWGLYFGLLLLVEKLFLKNILERLPGLIQWLYTILLVFLGWVLFAFEDFLQGASYLQQMAGVGVPAINQRTRYLLLTNLPLLLLAAIGCTAFPAACLRKWKNEKAVAVLEPALVLLILFLCTAFLVNAGYNPFLYFRF